MKKKIVTILDPDWIAEKHRQRAREIVDTLWHIDFDERDDLIELIAEACQCTENIALGITKIRTRNAKDMVQQGVTKDSQAAISRQERSDVEQAAASCPVSEVSDRGERPPWE